MDKEWILFQGKWIEVDWYGEEKNDRGTDEGQTKEVSDEQDISCQ